MPPRLLGREDHPGYQEEDADCDAGGGDSFRDRVVRLKAWPNVNSRYLLSAPVVHVLSGYIQSVNGQGRQQIKPAWISGTGAHNREATSGIGGQPGNGRSQKAQRTAAGHGEEGLIEEGRRAKAAEGGYVGGSHCGGLPAESRIGLCVAVRRCPAYGRSVEADPVKGAASRSAVGKKRLVRARVWCI